MLSTGIAAALQGILRLLKVSISPPSRTPQKLSRQQLSLPTQISWSQRQLLKTMIRH